MDDTKKYLVEKIVRWAAEKSQAEAVIAFCSDYRAYTMKDGADPRWWRPGCERWRRNWRGNECGV